jgi:hypothetical protein
MGWAVRPGFCFVGRFMGYGLRKQVRYLKKCYDLLISVHRRRYRLLVGLDATAIGT